MAFSFTKPTKEYRDAVLTVIGAIYDVTLDYFIKKSPKEIVTELKEDKYFDNAELIHQIIERIKRNPHNYNMSVFTESPINTVTQLYYCIFGPKGEYLNEFIYLKRGKGWCQRYFPPTDNEMYKFIVDSVTIETKRQYINPIKL